MVDFVANSPSTPRQTPTHTTITLATPLRYDDRTPQTTVSKHRNYMARANNSRLFNNSHAFRSVCPPPRGTLRERSGCVISSRGTPSGANLVRSVLDANPVCGSHGLIEEVNTFEGIDEARPRVRVSLMCKIFCMVRVGCGFWLRSWCLLCFAKVVA